MLFAEGNTARTNDGKRISQSRFDKHSEKGREVILRRMLTCLGCDKDFTHTEFSSDSELSANNPFASPVKPAFPDGGMTLTCPNCKRSSLYQRSQLVYRAV